MSELTYHLEQTVSGATYEAVVERVATSLKEEGFGVLTEAEYKDTSTKKPSAGARRYVIFGTCAPNLAHDALNKESHLGLLIPCDVVVQEKTESEVTVSIADPKVMSELADNPGLQSMALEAERRLKRVLRTLANGEREMQ